jgi:hypothetical protein
MQTKTRSDPLLATDIRTCTGVLRGLSQFPSSIDCAAVAAGHAPRTICGQYSLYQRLPLNPTRTTMHMRQQRLRPGASAILLLYADSGEEKQTTHNRISAHPRSVIPGDRTLSRWAQEAHDRQQRIHSGLDSICNCIGSALYHIAPRYISSWFIIYVLQSSTSTKRRRLSLGSRYRICLPGPRIPAPMNFFSCETRRSLTTYYMHMTCHAPKDVTQRLGLFSGLVGAYSGHGHYYIRIR